MPQDSNGTNERLCSRCGQNPKANGHEWCKECKRTKQAEYNEQRDAMMERRGYMRGAAAMREVIAMKLNALGLGMLTGVECAVWASNEPIPAPAESLMHDTSQQGAAAVGVSERSVVA